MPTLAEGWREEGREEKTIDIVKNSLKEGFSVNAISRITGLSSDKIEQIKEDMVEEKNSPENIH